MNEAMLRTLKSKNENYKTNEKIKEYLKDEALFFKIEKTRALKILETVGVKQEKLEEIYKKLTSPDMFYNLLNNGIIKCDDNLNVRYNIYR